jgi:hypothetical protein
MRSPEPAGPATGAASPDVNAVRPVLAPATPDLDDLARRGAEELLAGEAELTQVAESAIRRGSVAALAGWCPVPALPGLTATLCGWVRPRSPCPPRTGSTRRRCCVTTASSAGSCARRMPRGGDGFLIACSAAAPGTTATGPPSSNGPPGRGRADPGNALKWSCDDSGSCAVEAAASVSLPGWRCPQPRGQARSASATTNRLGPSRRARRSR